jgi:hypothetical protein
MNYYTTLLNNNKNNTKKVWQTTNKIMGKSRKPLLIKELVENKIGLKKNKHIANKLNISFNYLGNSSNLINVVPKV